METSPREFPIRFSRLSRRFFTPLLLGARRATVELKKDALIARMGWAFRATIPRASIRRGALNRDVWWAIGVHSDLRFRTWPVNGSKEGIVFLDLDPPGRGRAGPFPITIRRLGLGLEAPEGLLRALGVAPDADVRATDPPSG